MKTEISLILRKVANLCPKNLSLWKKLIFFYICYYLPLELNIPETQYLSMVCLIFLFLFQKEWKTGARVGTRSVWGAQVENKCTCAPPPSPPKNNPTIERAPALIPDFRSFWKWTLTLRCPQRNYGFKWRLGWTICSEIQTFTVFLSTPALTWSHCA